MCMELICPAVESGAERLATIGEFRKRYGEPVFIHPKHLFADEHCLCPVDIAATAAKMGLSVTVEQLTWRIER